MDLLVTLDEGYLPQLRVLLTSIHLNHPQGAVRVYLLHRSIPPKALESLQRGLEDWGWSLQAIAVPGDIFAQAPVTGQYPQEMYYRLLAAQFLPQELERVLYLDPDILVINSLAPLWSLDLDGHLFAAAAHSNRGDLPSSVNKLRLKTEGRYFNSGVLLMDLSRCRREIRPQDIFDYVSAHPAGLLLPDQDILNALYGGRVLELDDYLWNYDARYYKSYFLASSGEADLAWVMDHTAILHFCGRAKPWKPHYAHRFGVLYRHYMTLARRLLPEG